MKESKIRQIIKEEKDTLYGLMAVLRTIEKDWGKDSDLYYEFEDALVSGDYKQIDAVLNNYDVYEDYGEAVGRILNQDLSYEEDL